MAPDQQTTGAAANQYRQADRLLLFTTFCALIGYGALLAIVIGDAVFLQQRQTMPQASFVYGGAAFFNVIHALSLLRLCQGQRQFWDTYHYLESHLLRRNKRPQST